MCKKSEYQKVLKEEFFRLPNSIFKIKLPARAVVVFGYLVSCPETFNPSIERISNETGLSEPTVRGGVKDLEDKNMLKVTPRKKRGGRSRYGITPHTEWAKTLSTTLMEVDKSTAASSQEIYPQVGKKIAHIQEEQDLPKGKKELVGTPTVNLGTLIGQCSDVINSRKPYSIPNVITTFLCDHDLDFTVENFLAHLEPLFIGPKSEKILNAITPKIRTAFWSAKAERERSDAAILEFAMSKLNKSWPNNPTTTNGKESA